MQHFMNHTSLLKNYIVFSFDKLAQLLAWHIDRLHFLLMLLSRTCSKGLSIDYVSTSLILIWMKIQVQHKAEHWNRSINMDSPLELNQRIESKWSNIWFKGSVPERLQPTWWDRLSVTMAQWHWTQANIASKSKFGTGIWWLLQKYLI